MDPVSLATILHRKEADFKKTQCFGTIRPAQHDSIVSVHDSVNKKCDNLQQVLPHRSMFVRMKTSECRKLINEKAKG